MAVGLRSFSPQERHSIASRRAGGKGLSALAAQDYIKGPSTDNVAKVSSRMGKRLQKRIENWNRYQRSPEGMHEHKCPGSNKHNLKSVTSNKKK